MPQRSLAILAFLASAASIAHAQQVLPSETLAPATALGTVRLPLFREGSVISRLVGDLTQDPDEKIWLFRPSTPEAGGLRREFGLLPSPVLEDMLRTVKVAGAPVEFEVTGRVFIYRGRNFLLPDFAPRIMRFDAKPGETPAPAATDAAKPAPNGEDRFVPPTGSKGDQDAQEDATVAEIERKLEERVGRAPQARVSETSTTRASQPQAEAPIASGTRMSARLGRLARDPQTGSWRFVPEQTSGTGDPSIEVLPCLLLERLEDAARESDKPPAVLLTGTIYAFEGRSFVLPTSYRRAREGRGIGG